MPRKWFDEPPSGSGNPMADSPGSTASNWPAYSTASHRGQLKRNVIEESDGSISGTSAESVLLHQDVHGTAVEGG
jgi:hypothetical protein